MSLIFTVFDHINEGPEKLFPLYDKVYGGSEAIRKRWHWEFIQHPRAHRYRFFIAEGANGELAGMTVRMPLDVRVGDDAFPAYFATNSMVNPAYRGQNLICRLYEIAREDGALHLSKGTTPAMQRQLRKLDYTRIEPNNYQVCLTAPLRWAAGRITGKVFRSKGRSRSLAGFSDFERIDRFDGAFEAVVPEASAVAIKTADEMNWRYIDPPHRQYHCYARRKNGTVISWCAVRCDGYNAMFADVRWRPGEVDEPVRTIRFAKALAKHLGAVKLTCWSHNVMLRGVLGREFFMQRKESPGFAFFSHDDRWHQIRWDEAHFVHGDGDAEYI